jgi:hypothetical protein
MKMKVMHRLNFSTLVKRKLGSKDLLQRRPSFEVATKAEIPRFALVDL